MSNNPPAPITPEEEARRKEFLGSIPRMPDPFGPLTPQPAPVETSGPAIWDLVIEDTVRVYGARDGDAVPALIEDMRERDRQGRERYGVPLQAHNGRDALVDAYQEALDGCAYTRQAMEESDRDSSEWYWYQAANETAIRHAMHLRRLLTAREERSHG